MPREVRQHNKPSSKRSRSRGRHRPEKTRDTSHRDDADKSSGSGGNDQLVGEAAGDQASKVAPWSDPVLDTHSRRFQYQYRPLPDGTYQWTISGSDSGTNPQYLSSASTSNVGYHLGFSAYPTSAYIVQQPMQTEVPYSNPGNTGAEPATLPDLEAGGECTCKDCRKEKAPHEDKSETKQKKTSEDDKNDKNNKRDGRRRSCSRQRNRSSHRRQHYRSKSRGDKDRQRGSHRGRSLDEKVNDWLYDYDYGY
ncbi:hypothetical protein F5Y08DRAFT_309391 [Xylaria arbuscula]|nr:hypothetical protein F5Y08DRAFT_309391 [Xylaria arbuscula]